jgi:beta-N-acetylglucosaminidase
MRKKFGKLVLTIGLTVGSLLSFYQPTAYAQDDITGSTLETEMRAMIAEGIMQGYGDGIYKPNLDVTRGQFATFISRALELPAGDPVFTDVPLSSKVAPGVNSAYAAGIVAGKTPTIFEPNNPVSRQEVAVMVDRAFTYMQIEREDAELKFTDADQIRTEFKPAVAKNARDKIINGLSNGDGTYRFLPGKTASRQEAAAFIYRMLNKMEESELPTDPGDIKEEGYKVATINSSRELTYSKTTYSTFDAAKSAMGTSSNQVITLNDQIVKMNAGIVRSKPSLETAITILYKDPSLSSASAFTYINAHQELRYLDATETYVKVSLAGKTFYTKQSEVALIPLPLIDNRNYYIVNDAGDLLHMVYNVVKAKEEFINVGPAPSFLVKGGKYYSWDGAQFYSLTGQPIDKPVYQYFNYLHARTASAYTAEEINKYIADKLAALEASGNPYYKDATKKSKLIGLGTYLKDAEVKNKVNALLILGIAMNESGNGMSTYSQERNNLFGLGAVDSNPDAAYRYNSPGESVDAFVNAFMNQNYYYPQKYANGFALGNKARGFNVKYAADPFWGEKAAQHWYTIDKTLGKKDFGKYRIAETTVDGVYARFSPGIAPDTVAYSYKTQGSQVVIIGEVQHTDGYKWYKLISDSSSPTQNVVYAREDMIRELPIAR